jgi:hypothetical protein
LGIYLLVVVYVEQQFGSCIQGKCILLSQFRQGKLLQSLQQFPFCKTQTAAPHKPPPEDKFPKNYFVPNFGADKDMIATQKHYSIAEARLKHKLIMGTPESRAKYHNKAKDTLYDYNPKLDKDVITT